MKIIVVGDVEAIRTYVRRRTNEDKITNLTHRRGWDGDRVGEGWVKGS